MKLKILYKLRICDNNLHSKKIGGLLVLWDFGWVGQNSNKEPLFNFAIYLSKVPILLHVKIIVILPCVEDSIKIGHFYTIWTWSRTWLRFNPLMPNDLLARIHGNSIEETSQLLPAGSICPEKMLHVLIGSDFFSLEV